METLCWLVWHLLRDRPVAKGWRWSRHQLDCCLVPEVWGGIGLNFLLGYIPAPRWSKNLSCAGGAAIASAESNFCSKFPVVAAGHLPEPVSVSIFRPWLTWVLTGCHPWGWLCYGRPQGWRQLWPAFGLGCIGSALLHRTCQPFLVISCPCFTFVRCCSPVSW